MLSIFSKIDKKSADIILKNLDFNLFMIKVEENENILFNEEKDVIFRIRIDSRLRSSNCENRNSKRL
jgi:hypothetical protein